MLHETLRALLRQHGGRKRAAGGVEYDIERPIESRPGVSMWTGRAHDYLLPPSDWRAKRDEWIVGLIDPLEKRDTFPKRDGGAARSIIVRVLTSMQRRTGVQPPVTGRWIPMR